MSEENKAIVRHILEGIWNEKNPALIPDYIAADHVIHNPDGAYQGLDRYRSLYDTWTTAFPNLRFIIEDQVAEGNKVMTHFTFEGTQEGKLGDIEPTGNKVAVTGILICHLSDGKAIEERGVWDSLRLMQQLGVVPS